jgi:hypothetical protein
MNPPSPSKGKIQIPGLWYKAKRLYQLNQPAPSYVNLLILSLPISLAMELIAPQKQITDVLV